MIFIIQNAERVDFSLCLFICSLPQYCREFPNNDLYEMYSVLCPLNTSQNKNVNIGTKCIKHFINFKFLDTETNRNYVKDYIGESRLVPVLNYLFTSP